MAIRDRGETETWLSETETRPRPLKNFTFFSPFFFHLLNLLWPFWGLYTVDSRYNKLLGPSEITLLYQNFVICGLQNNKIQRNVELWDQENYFVISDFVISVFFITRVHCIYTLPRTRSGLEAETSGFEAETRPRTEISGLEAYNTGI